MDETYNPSTRIPTLEETLTEIDDEIARLQMPEGREVLESIGIDTYYLLARLKETRIHLQKGRRSR